MADLHQEGSDKGAWGRPAHLVVGSEHIKVPQDLRKRGAWGAAHSFDITPIHLVHNFGGDLHFGNHCEAQTDSKSLICFQISSLSSRGDHLS